MVDLTDLPPVPSLFDEERRHLRSGISFLRERPPQCSGYRTRSRAVASGVEIRISPVEVLTPIVGVRDRCAFLTKRIRTRPISMTNVATVLQELAERLDGGELVRVAEADGEVAYAQRLGYLLDRAGRQEVARALAEWVDARAPRVTPLSPGAPITGAERDARWRVAVNEEVYLEARA